MAGTKRPESEITEDESDEQPPARPPQAELWLLKLLLLTPELTDFAVNHLDPAWITDDRVRRIAAVHLY